MTAPRRFSAEEMLAWLNEQVAVERAGYRYQFTPEARLRHKERAERLEALTTMLRQAAADKSQPTELSDGFRPVPQHSCSPNSTGHRVELEPNGQNSRSGNPHRQSGEGREVRGRTAILTSGVQCCERDVRGEELRNNQVTDGGGGGLPSAATLLLHLYSLRACVEHFKDATGKLPSEIGDRLLASYIDVPDPEGGNPEALNNTPKAAAEGQGNEAQLRQAAQALVDKLDDAQILLADNKAVIAVNYADELEALDAALQQVDCNPNTPTLQPVAIATPTEPSKAAAEGQGNCAGFIWFRFVRPSQWHVWGQERTEGGDRYEESVYVQTCLHCGKDRRR